MCRIAIILCTILFSSFGYSQGSFDIGVKGGISRDRIQVNNVADLRGVTGHHAGLFARVKAPLTPGVQIELLYNTMGTDILVSDTSGADAQVRLNYLQLPLFLMFTLGPAELHFGGYGSYLLNSSISQPTAVQAEIQQLKDDQYMDVDYGLLGGVGVRLKSFYAGARYTIGLGTVGEADNDILGNARNMQAQLYIGIGFR